MGAPLLQPRGAYAVLSVRLGAALCAALLVGCRDSPVVPTQQGQGPGQSLNATITLTPDSAAGWVPEGITLRVQISGPDADSLRKQPVWWSSVDPNLVALARLSDTSAVAIPQHDGVAQVIATVGDVADTAKIVCWEEGAPLAVTEYSTSTLTFTQSVAVGADGMIYLPTYEDALLAFDADLAPAWEFPMLGPGWMNVAIADDGSVIAPSLGGLVALSPGGTLLWQDTTLSTIESAPAIDREGQVWLGGFPGMGSLAETYGVAHYDATGNRIAFVGTGYTIKVPPVIVGDSVVVIANIDGRVFGISRADSILWVDTLPRALRYFAPAVAGDGRTVYLPGNYGPIVAIDGFTGEVFWSWGEGLLGAVSPPIVDADGTIYVQAQGRLVALNPDGSVRWIADSLKSYNGPSASTAPALAAGGVLYVPCLWDVCAVNTSDGSVRWRHSLPSQVTAGLIAGTILVLPDSSILFATISHLLPSEMGPGYPVKLRGRYPLADAPWSVDGGDLQRTRRGRTP